MKPSILKRLRYLEDKYPRVGWNIALSFALAGGIVLYDVLDSFFPSFFSDLSATQLLVRYALVVIGAFNFFCYFPDEPPSGPSGGVLDVV